MSALDRLKAAAQAADPQALHDRLNSASETPMLTARLTTLRLGEIEWVYVLPKKREMKVPA
jgi:hypothetical protein